MNIEKASTADERKKLYELVDELQDVRKKLKDTQEADSSWFFSDSANDAAVQALKKTKDRIAQEIRELELKITPQKKEKSETEN